MVGVADDMTAVEDDLLEKQLNGIINKQLEELGFADLCRRIASQVVDRVKQIDEEHKEIKQVFDILGGRLDTLLAEQDHEEALLLAKSENLKKTEAGESVIIIDDEDDDRHVCTNSASVNSLNNQLTLSVPSATAIVSKPSITGPPAPKTSAASKPSSSTKKIESVILNLKASKASSSIKEPSNLNDLFSFASPDKRKRESPLQIKDTVDETVCSLPNVFQGSSKPFEVEQTGKESGTAKSDALGKIDVFAETSKQTIKENDMGDEISSLKNSNEMLRINEAVIHQDKDRENEIVSVDKHFVENIASTEEMNQVYDQVKTKGKLNTNVKTLPKIIIQRKNSEEISEDTMPPDLSQPLKVNTPSDNPPDLSNSLLFPEVLSSPDINIGVNSVVDESPLKVSLDITDVPNWPHLDPADEIDMKGDPYLPTTCEGSFDLLVGRDVDADMPFVKTEDVTMSSKPGSPIASPELEEHNDSPLKSPVIVETSNNSKLITKIRLPEDFQYFEHSFSPKKTKYLPEREFEAQIPTKVNRSLQLKLGITVYAQPYLSDIWYQAEIVKKAVNFHLEPKYIVRFLSGQKVRQKVSMKNMASLDAILTDEIELGSRIVAGRPSDTVNSTISKKYKDINSGTNINVMFAGIVAERACPENNNRYLVFFDDGYAQYLTRNRMFPVISPSPNVWEDVSEDCQEFIKEYLQEYPYRPLVCTKIHSNMQTEWNGSWWKSKVVSIDASLVKVLFDVDKRSEWIYRGTTRLEPMYDHFAPTPASKKKKKKLTESYVDERITHPNFGICKYSLKDPEGRQQRAEWNFHSPVAIKREFKLVDEIVEKLQKPPKLKTADASPLSYPLNLKTLKRSSSVLSSASDSSKASGDVIKTSIFKSKRQRLISDSESNHSTEGSVERDSTISSKEAVGVLYALHMSPSGSETSCTSHRSLKTSSPMTERSRASHAELVKVFDVNFIKNAREQGATYESIAAHYRSIYPNCGANRKNVGCFCRRHGILKDETLLLVSSDKAPEKKVLENLSMNTPVTKEEIKATTQRGPHQCTEGCIADQRSLLDHYRGTYNYLAVPLALGWKRESCKRQSGYHRDIYYQTPCNRRLRNLAEVTRYLLETKATNVYIDMFCFLSNISCRNQSQKPKPAIIRIDDLSSGKESCCIVCINEHTDEYPPKVSYAASRIKTEDVAINTDPGFLVCCDCTDNCQDKTKCGCAQLTIESSNAIDNIINPNAGYSYRRLKEHTISGIYECNQNCGCSRDTCYNRVVQNGIQLRLQVFMTENRGWGLRCIDDIPKGTFICTYAGQVLNEHTANREGMDYGDEYLAELDHIEVVEKAKDGYESDVPELRVNNHVSEESSDDESESGSDSSSTSVLFISSDTSESSDDEQVILTDDESPPKTLPCVETKVVTSSVSSTGSSSSSNASPSHQNIDQNDVVPCHISLERIPSVDLPKRIDSTDESFITDESNGGFTDANSSFGNNLSASQILTTKNSTVEKDVTPNPASSPVQDHPLEGASLQKNGQNLSESHLPKRTKPTRRLVPVARKSTCQKAYALKSTGSRVIDEELKAKSNLNNSKEENADDSKPSMRSLYDGDKQMYIIDAKSVGNVGRYMNHSCAPNVFVQNVMVDTHDLRFPWVAFFAQQNICAYTELTWDYNYEIGSVPGKMLICKCGARNCKGRLL